MSLSQAEFDIHRLGTKVYFNGNFILRNVRLPNNPQALEMVSIQLPPGNSVPVGPITVQ